MSCLNSFIMVRRGTQLKKRSFLTYSLSNSFTGQVVPREQSGYVDYDYERNFYAAKIYGYISSENSSLSIDRIHTFVYTRIEKNERLLLNLLNSVFIWFNFYLVDFLELFLRIARFFYIFRLANLKKCYFFAKTKIDFFFSKRARVSPIFSLSGNRVN